MSLSSVILNKMRATWRAWRARCLSLQHSTEEQQNTMFIVNRIDSACLGKLTSVENRTQVNPLHFSIDFCNSSMPNKKKVGILLQQKNRDRSMWCVSLYLQSSRTRCAPRGAQDAFLQQNNTEQQNAVFIVNRIDSACLGKLIIVETRTQVNPIHFSIDSCKLGMPRFFSYSGSTACFFYLQSS